MIRKIELFGRLKDAGLGAAVELDLSDGSTAGAVLAALREKLGRLMDGSVLATEDAVLSDEDRLPESKRLAALPPVCGG